MSQMKAIVLYSSEPDCDGIGHSYHRVVVPVALATQFFKAGGRFAARRQLDIAEYRKSLRETGYTGIVRDNDAPPSMRAMYLSGIKEAHREVLVQWLTDNEVYSGWIDLILTVEKFMSRFWHGMNEFERSYFLTSDYFGYFRER